MQTMMQNWNRIDRLRVDKFMMLSRVFLHQIVAVLDGLGWCGSSEPSPPTIRRRSARPRSPRIHGLRQLPFQD